MVASSFQIRAFVEIIHEHWIHLLVFLDWLARIYN